VKRYKMRIYNTILPESCAGPSGFPKYRYHQVSGNNSVKITLEGSGMRNSPAATKLSSGTENRDGWAARATDAAASLYAAAQVNLNAGDPNMHFEAGRQMLQKAGSAMTNTARRVGL
jgi:hypothetical protein